MKIYRVGLADANGPMMQTRCGAIEVAYGAGLAGSKVAHPPTAPISAEQQRSCSSITYTAESSASAI